jgi:hypothetical protein
MIKVKKLQIFMPKFSAIKSLKVTNEKAGFSQKDHLSNNIKAGASLLTAKDNQKHMGPLFRYDTRTVE